MKIARHRPTRRTPDAPVRIEADADVLRVLGIQQLDAVQEYIAFGESRGASQLSKAWRGTR